MLDQFDWILFDADHTLFDFDRSSKASLTDVLADYGVSCTDEQFADYFEINRRCWQQYEKGEISREVLATRRFDIFFDKYGISGIDPVAFNRDYLNGLPNYPFMMDTERGKERWM